MREHGTKTTPVFLPANREPYLSLLPSSVSLLLGGTVQPENTTSVHLPKPVWTDQTVKPDLVLTNPIGKDGVQSWLM